jgi:hypothetical protein
MSLSFIPVVVLAADLRTCVGDRHAIELACMMALHWYPAAAPLRAPLLDRDHDELRAG